MAQQVKELVAKPDLVGSIPGTHMVGDVLPLIGCALNFTCTPRHMDTHMHTLSHTHT